MTRALHALLIACGLAGAPLAMAAAVQPPDLGPGVTEYQRFITYPHLEKAFSAQARGDHATALKHFRRASELLPGNPALAVYLADAWRRAGDRAQQAEVLSAQLRLTPTDAGVRAALAQATDTTTAPATAKTTTTTAVRAAGGRAPARPRPSAPVNTAGAETPVATPAAADPVATALARGEAERALADALAEWQRHAVATRLDSVSFQLAAAGAHAQASRLLVETWPWPGADDATRAQLLARLGHVNAQLATPPDLSPLANILPPTPETPPLRAARAALFAQAGDCTRVSELLGDFSPAYERDDWLRLGDCLRTRDPQGARRAYQEAFVRATDATTVRALAYQSYAVRDFAGALTAWGRLPVKDTTPADQLAAATTAVAVPDFGVARRWLDDYAAAGGVQDAAYWRLRAQARGPADPRGAVADLEQAAGLAPDDRDTQRALAWARLAAGDTDGARRDFTALAAHTPVDLAATDQLAWLALDAGDLDGARRATARALDARGADDATADALRLRRLHENLGRRWAFSAGLWSGTRTAAVSNAPAPGDAFRSFLELEARYRLGEGRARVEDRFGAYARLVADSGDDGDAFPWHSPVLGIGLRVKPFATQVAYLAVEPQVPLDNAGGVDPDVMLRASASFLDTGRHGDDWHADGRGWHTRALYLDAAHFIDAGRSSLLADLSAGYHHKLRTPGQTLQPRAHLQYGNQVDGGNNLEDIRAGIGVQWNRWHGATRHDAWAHRTTIGLEFQHAFRSYLRETDTVALSASLRW